MMIDSKILAAQALIVAAIKDFNSRYGGDKLELENPTDAEEIEKLGRMIVALYDDIEQVYLVAKKVSQWT